jgi:small subunit ribosomal protein S6
MTAIADVKYHAPHSNSPAPELPGPRAHERRVQREAVFRVRPYEVMVIFDASLEEEAIRAVLDRATAIIRAQGGNPGRVDRWGKRRFAYELHHRWEGYYVLMDATAEPGAMDELDRMFHLADEVIRHKVIRLPEKVAGRAQRPAPALVDAAPEATPDANGA